MRLLSRLVCLAIALHALGEAWRASSASVLLAWWGVAMVAVVAAVRGGRC